MNKREYIFKAKSNLNGEWKVGYLNHQLIPHKGFIPYICDFNGKYWEIIEDTISERVFSFLQKGKENLQIFENDIVEMELHSGTKYKYLIWFSREMESLVVLEFEGLQSNGDDDYWNCNRTIALDEFSFMLHDFYGHNKDIRIIGNVFDNPELLDFAKEGN